VPECIRVVASRSVKAHVQRQQSTSKPTRTERDLQPRPRPAATTAQRAPGEALLRLQSVAGNQAVARLLDEREVDPSSATAAATPAATASPEAPKRPWWRRALGRLADAAKERLLRPLAGIASKVPGYGLLAFALGRDPISGAAVERGGNALLKAVVQLIPGGGAVMASIEQSGALQRAGTWLSAEVPKLGLTWEAIGGLFARAFRSLKLTDVFSPAAAWERLAGIFGPPLARLRAFASAALGKLRELAFEAALAMGGGLAGQVMAVLRRGGSVLGSIFANPIGFAGNLIGAVRGGLGRFAANIGSHLKTGLFGWLFGALRGVIELPQRVDLRGVGSVVLQLLGLTWGRLRERLVVRLGAPRVSFIERSVDFVRRIATEGLSAVWEKVLEFASGLTDTVIGGIREWVTNSIVGAAVAKLVTMFNPAGALIQAILSIYRAVQWLIQQAHQLGALATSIFDSLAAIASGSIGGAISAVENALARTLPVVISFLAGQVGLGSIGEEVRGVVNRVRGVVERAMERVGNFIAARFGRPMGRRGEAADGADKRTPEQKKEALDQAIKEADVTLRDPSITVEELPPRLAPIRSRHRLTSLTAVTELETQGTATLHVEGAVNPRKKSPPRMLAKAGEVEVVVIRRRVGPAVPRKHFERMLLPGSKIGMKDWQRAHSQGAGTGYESDRGILYAPTMVNQELQNRGIERLIRELYAERRPDAGLALTTVTTPHPGTSVLKQIEYKLEGEFRGERHTLIEASINIDINWKDLLHPRVTFEADRMFVPNLQWFRERALR
jgi:Bacterial toxin 4